MSDPAIKISMNTKSFSRTWKLLLIAGLVLVLMIPSVWIGSLIRERDGRNNEVISEIAGKWGSSQAVSGPILAVPYEVQSYSTGSDGVKKPVSKTEYLYVSPDELTLSGTVKSEVRKRGIYKVSGFTADLTVDAEFDPAALPGEQLQIAGLDWGKALVMFDITDQRGLKSLDGNLNGEPLSFNSSRGVLALQYEPTLKPDTSAFLRPYLEGDQAVEGGFKFEAAPPSDIRDRKLKLHLDLSLTGTQSLRVNNTAIRSQVSLQGDWPSPSFAGDLLPDTRSVDRKGFSAAWQANELSTGVKKHWTSQEPAARFSNVGLDFLIMVDSYRQASRALKYCILFLALTFMTFFFAETILKQRIHPVQYLMVGSSLLLFYLLLLSISEYLPFGWSYLIAALGIVGQITAYCFTILKSRRFAFQVGGLIAGLYAFLYVLLRLEDSALLVGSISLFVFLSVAMYAIRNIKWYGQED